MGATPGVTRSLMGRISRIDPECLKLLDRHLHLVTLVPLNLQINYIEKYYSLEYLDGIYIYSLQLW